MPKIVFHIGVERTGTTVLQHFCYQNRRLLSENSICYPTRNLGFRGVSHRELVAAYVPTDQQDDVLRSKPAERSRILESLKGEIDASGAKTILISAEHFSSRLRQTQIHELAADFGDFDRKIVVFLRDHVSQFFSAYAMHVAAGGSATIDQFANSILHPDSRYCRYDDMIRPWAEAFGKPNIEVQEYRRAQDVVAQFFFAGGPTPLAADILVVSQRPRFDLLARRSNRSLAPRHVEWLRAVNSRVRQLRLPRAIEEVWRHSARGFLHLAEGADRLFGANRDESWSLDQGRLDRLIAMAEADEALLKDNYGISFLRAPSVLPAPSYHEPLRGVPAREPRTGSSRDRRGRFARPLR